MMIMNGDRALFIQMIILRHWFPPETDRFIKLVNAFSVSRAQGGSNAKGAAIATYASYVGFPTVAETLLNGKTVIIYAWS